MRKISQIISYYLSPILISFIVFSVKNHQIYSKMGTFSFLLLTLILFIKPLSVLFSKKIFKVLMTYRRELGLLSFWLFAGHVVGLYNSHSYSIKEAFSLGNYLFSGTIAGIGMLILALTSNNKSMKYFKRNWKKIQQLAYPVYYLTIIHIAIIDGKIVKNLAFAGTYTLLKFLEYRRKSIKLVNKDLQ